MNMRKEFKNFSDKRGLEKFKDITSDTKDHVNILEKDGMMKRRLAKLRNCRTSSASDQL